MVSGRADFATAAIDGETPPWGDLSYRLHQVVYLFLERSPRRIPPHLNLLYPFDRWTWMGIGSAFAAVSAAICVVWMIGGSIHRFGVTKIIQFFSQNKYILKLFLSLRAFSCP